MHNRRQEQRNYNDAYNQRNDREARRTGRSWYNRGYRQQQGYHQQQGGGRQRAQGRNFLGRPPFQRSRYKD